MKVLLLAGTAEAARLAVAVAGRDDMEVVASLAGRTRHPAPLPCELRVGGFGGVDGLVDALRDGGFDALVDATHAFARLMPAHAAAAAAKVGIPRLRLLRSGWSPLPIDAWHEVDDIVGAASATRALGAQRVLLTIGRQELGPFVALGDVQLVVRSVDPPSPPIDDAIVVLGRGPFDEVDEARLLADHDIDTLVTRNSGGSRAKLDAAARAGVRVVMVRRPPPTPGPEAATVADAVAWLTARQAERATNGQSAQ